MKYCPDNKKNHCLLVGLVTLLVTGYTSAADKKLLPPQQLRSINPGYTVHVPVNGPPPIVPPATIKQTKTKPVKKSAGRAPVAPLVMKKRPSPGVAIKPTGIPPGVPVRAPIKSLPRPVKPAISAPRTVHPKPALSHKTRLPTQALPVLPIPPVRQAPPAAPVVINPRNSGFAPPPPVVRRAAPSAKQNYRSTGSSSTSGHGFSLSPLNRSATGAGSPSQRGGFAPVGRAGQQTNSPTERLNRITGQRKTPAHRGGFAPDQVYGGTTPSGGRASARPSPGRKKSPGNAFNNPVPGSGTSTSRPVVTVPFSAASPRSKDDERSGEYANDILNDWAEDDMAIGGGKVPDPDNAPIYKPPAQDTKPSAAHEFNNGTDVTSYGDGSSDSFDAAGGHLETSSGIKVTPGANGGTDVEDRQTGVTGHFGAENVRDDAGEIKEGPPGSADLPDGGRITDESNGSISVGNVDGSTDTWQRDGSHLQTGPGIKTVATPDGGTDVIGPDGKYEAHFGGGATSTERSKPKYIGGGTVQNPDGSKEKGDKSESDFSSDSNDSTDSSGSDNGSDDNNNSDEDSDNSSDDNADTSSDNNDDSDNSDEDSGGDDNGDDTASSDEARAGFEGARGGDGGPEAAAKTTVDDRVARMKGEKRDPESPDDAEPGNGGSAPDSVSQPGPGGDHRASPLARPSAEGRQPLVNGVVTPTVKSRSSVGGGDCFKREGCDNAVSGGFKLDPLNRDPVTNPGGH